jgi:tetratricopeptide (TPR) repeat protein
VDQDFHIYGFALLNIAEIDVSIGAPKNYVQRMCEKAREIFNTRNCATEVIMCDMILADLQLRERNFLAAKTLFERCIRSSLHPGIRSFCLERLGDTSSWDAYDLGCATIFLVHSIRRKEKLGIHKALQFLGDVLLAQDDEQTAISLFMVALEGFTWMDVHRSAAECMLRLGNISMKHGDFLKALKLWETARPLFERSSQTKQVEHIDERLAAVGEDVFEQYRNSLSHLAELNAVSSTVQEVEDHITDSGDSDKED